MRLNSRITGALVSAVIIMSVGTTVYADPTADSFNQQSQQFTNQATEYNQSTQLSQLNAESAQNDIKNLNMQIEALDSNIEELNRIISDTNEKISAKEAEIQIAQENLNKAEAEVQSQQELLDKRVRVIYVAGGYEQYISILLSSKDFNDFFIKAQAIGSIINFDGQVVKELSDKKEMIKSDEAALEKDRDDLLSFKQDNVNKLAEVQSKMKDQQKLVAEAKSRHAYYMSQIIEYKNRVTTEDKKVQDAINQLQALAQTLNVNYMQNKGGSVQADPNSVIVFAYNLLGDPYLWGAEGNALTQADINLYKNTDHDVSDMENLIGRQVFDCSGLVKYVYAHFGINLSRTTFTQINEGIAVDRNSLKPGDLIFFGTYSNPHHVGIYVGNNCYIHAPFSGDVVRVSSLDYSDQYLCARRILN